MTTYAEKLLDPRWQKKRLEIFERDKWTCRECKNTKDTLHVHHKKYIKGKEPWEYDNEDLETLCMECHELLKKPKEIQKAIRKIEGVLASKDLILAIEKVLAYEVGRLNIGPFGNSIRYHVIISRNTAPENQVHELLKRKRDELRAKNGKSST